MTTFTVTLNLPQDVYQRFFSSSNTLREPVEKLISQSIQGNLPPSLEDLPQELQNEIGVSLHHLSSQALWQIVNDNVDSEMAERHQVLLEKNQDEELSEAEAIELMEYRSQMDNEVMRRSYALALLKWRGFAHSLTPSSPTVNGTS